FFSSRRRHTRFSRDWSSDVCSSDLHTTEFTTLFHLFAVSLKKDITLAFNSFIAGFHLYCAANGLTLTSLLHLFAQLHPFGAHGQIGRASCRERGCIRQVDGAGQQQD